MDAIDHGGPSLGRALGAVADTAIDQARDLAVGQLDQWAGCLHERLSAATTSAPSSSPLTPVITGAVAGAVVAWLLVGRRRED